MNKLLNDLGVSPQLQVDAHAILRIARELRELIADESAPEAKAVRDDLARMERVAHWLLTTRVIMPEGRASIFLADAFQGQVG